MSVIERCRIPPPDAAAEEVSLPLTYFDMFWINFFPVPRLLFYKFNCSKSDFVNAVIPDVKRSLSLALNHFLPFAGNLVCPTTSSTRMPEIQYRNGDSVSVEFAESDADLDYLTGDEPRDADKFYHLLPVPPPAVHAADARLLPILAVKVTLFLNRGVSVGLYNQHVIGDARTTVNFIRSWASICRNGGDSEFLADASLHPIFDRSSVNLAYGKLAEEYWNELRSTDIRNLPPVNPQGKVRATFVMEESNIKKLKNLAAAAKHVSSLTVTCGYVWSCLVKSGAAVGEEDGEEHITLAADYRRFLDPPLPDLYFGNCIGPLIAKSPRSRLIGDGGFAVAAELIGEAIYERLHRRREEVLKVVEDWPSDLMKVDWSRNTGTAGSPRFDPYDADFGWGKPAKFESISIDSDGSMSLCKSRFSERDLEIGISLPKTKMDAFVAIFNDGLMNLTSPP